jgi:hypothetical protein
MSDEILKLAFIVGKSVGVSQEAFAARLRLTNQSLMKDIDKDCGNMSILLERYATFCKALAQHPDQRLQQLIQCSIKKTSFPCEGH